MKTFEIRSKIEKIDEEFGIVFGKAMVCTEQDDIYIDRQDDFIPESAMFKAALDFMENSQVMSESHSGEETGAVVFAFPLSKDIAKAFEIETNWSGLMIGVRPAPDMLAKFRSGELTGFSIGGVRLVDEEAETEVEDEDA